MFAHSWSRWSRVAQENLTPTALTDPVREPLDSYGSYHPTATEKASCLTQPVASSHFWLTNQ